LTIQFHCQDIDISKELTIEFNEQMQERNVSFGYDFSAQVLSSATWPFQAEATSFNMPPVVR
jgi:hypothetical protein